MLLDLCEVVVNSYFVREKIVRITNEYSQTFIRSCYPIMFEVNYEQTRLAIDFSYRSDRLKSERLRHGICVRLPQSLSRFQSLISQQNIVDFSIVLQQCFSS